MCRNERDENACYGTRSSTQQHQGLTNTLNTSWVLILVALSHEWSWTESDAHTTAELYYDMGCTFGANHFRPMGSSSAKLSVSTVRGRVLTLKRKTYRLV